MFTRLSNSWELLKASARVLMADKELVVFPIISTIGVLLVTLTFALPMFFSNLFDNVFLGGRVEALGFVVAFLFYVVQYTVIFFANTALVGAALIRLRGGDPTVSDGFRIAASRMGPIIGYALIAATVGMILRAISKRSSGIGRLLVSLVGFAWNVATYLVVPVLAVENVGPIRGHQAQFRPAPPYLGRANRRQPGHGRDLLPVLPGDCSRTCAGGDPGNQCPVHRADHWGCGRLYPGDFHRWPDPVHPAKASTPRRYTSTLPRGRPALSSRSAWCAALLFPHRPCNPSLISCC